VSFTAEAGERVGILGPNGAGKSTLFKALVGILPHNDGSISVDEQDCRSSHRGVAYVPQNNDLDWDFPVTVWDVVMMGRTRHIGWFRQPGGKDRAVVAAMLDRVGMSAFQNRRLRQLSGGQRQRVFIARALAQESRVLLLDEPFSGVDVAAEEDIRALLARLSADGVTMLVATHDLQNAKRDFDRLLLLKKTVLAYGPAAEVLQPKHLQGAWAGDPSLFGWAEAASA
jgi:ABC-type Mn2+/Zn2+ transport system ATPase subunit